MPQKTCVSTVSSKLKAPVKSFNLQAVVTTSTTLEARKPTSSSEKKLIIVLASRLIYYYGPVTILCNPLIIFWVPYSELSIPHKKKYRR